ncbi:MAG: hypothetical protein O2840_03240 [bacterium]|nr:hypothetical protein [bacterium]
MNSAKRNTLLALCVGFAMALAVTNKVVSAQVAPAATAGVTAETIFLKRFSSEESQRLIRLYQDQYEGYRQTEREFVTAQAQYLQLKTLASLESAVVSSRNTMLERTDILITYHELLAATLVESIGVELELKQDTLGQLQESIQDLKTIHEKIAASDDRFKIQVANEQFEEVLVPQLYSVAYKTLSQLIVADLQNVFDKTKQVLAELKSELAESEVSKLELEERTRAYSEVDARITDVELQLATITARVKTEEVFDERFYQKTVEELQAVYGGLSQVMTYIEELERTIHE